MAGEPQWDFFISRNGADSDVAQWIAWVLKENDYSVLIQDWHFRPGEDFLQKMQDAATDSRHTIAVLSPQYLDAEFTQPEWRAAIALDAQGKKRQLIPVRVQPCKPPGLLATRIFIDLVGVDEAQAEKRLIDGIKETGEPEVRPPYPHRDPTAVTRPPFPSPSVPITRSDGKIARPPSLSSSVPITRSDGKIVGIVEGFRERIEKGRIPLWGNRIPEFHVWTFVVQPYDDSGNPLSPVQVEMRSEKFRGGSIYDGLEVEIEGRARPGDTLRPRKVKIVKTNAVVTATRTFL